MQKKHGRDRWILLSLFFWLLYKSYLQLSFFLLPCPWMLMAGGNQKAAWITSSALLLTTRLILVVDRSFRSSLSWIDVCGTFSSFWFLFKLRFFPINYLNQHKLTFFLKGTKNTSAYISAICCFFFQDICFCPLSKMMYWVNGLLVWSTAIFLVFLLKKNVSETAIKIL